MRLATAPENVQRYDAASAADSGADGWGNALCQPNTNPGKQPMKMSVIMRPFCCRNRVGGAIPLGTSRHGAMQLVQVRHCMFGTVTTSRVPYSNSTGET